MTTDSLKVLADLRDLGGVIAARGMRVRRGQVIGAGTTVPMQSILEDYLQTNAFDLRGRVLGRLASSRHPHQNISNALDDLIAPLLAADPCFLEATFEQRRVDYGSTTGYLSTVLGIDHHRLDQIRACLPEPAAGSADL